jgi:hypothetical protein
MGCDQSRKWKKAAQQAGRLLQKVLLKKQCAAE